MKEKEMKSDLNATLQLKLDESLAKTLRGLSVFDADISIRFVPKILVTAEAPQYTLEFFGSDDLEYFYEYDEVMDEMIRVEKEWDEYRRDQFILTYPIDNLKKEFSASLDLSNRNYLSAGYSLFCQEGALQFGL